MRYWHALTVGERLAFAAALLAQLCMVLAALRTQVLLAMVCGLTSGTLAGWLVVSLGRRKGDGL